ncbi:hypothetical protein NT6N_24650 [Oceaniferula spumae]|uniref:Uncharacterized protein n=1 Tax=Oceaniferula spumae TaxID=2979115 RepID=A0AAT9FN58_9BACT
MRLTRRFIRRDTVRSQKLLRAKDVNGCKSGLHGAVELYVRQE